MIIVAHLLLLLSYHRRIIPVAIPRASTASCCIIILRCQQLLVIRQVRESNAPPARSGRALNPVVGKRDSPDARIVIVTAAASSDVHRLLPVHVSTRVLLLIEGHSVEECGRMTPWVG